MKGDIFRVLQDTRNAKNPAVCECCGNRLMSITAHFTEDFNIWLFTCQQCGAVSSLLEERYENDSR